MKTVYMLSAVSLLFICMCFLTQSSLAQDTLCSGGAPNGILEGDEECDDNNNIAADGCTNCWFDCNITIEKSAVPADNTPFPFLRLTLSVFQSPVFEQFNLSDPASPTRNINVPFLSGTFIAELPPIGWELESLDCGPGNILEIQDNEVPEEFQEEFETVRSGNLVFAVCILGGSAACTYSDREIMEDTCNLTVSLEAPDGGSTEFPFNLLSESLDQDFDLRDGESIPFNDLTLNATLRITEFVPDQWMLDAIVCEGDADFDELINPDSVDITCNSEGDVTCTFVNSRIPVNTPALSESGLLIMAAILGFAGILMAIRRKKASA